MIRHVRMAFYDKNGSGREKWEDHGRLGLQMRPKMVVRFFFGIQRHHGICPG